MMINCPKCNLLQPKDQYCAQCGINMETWKPPEKPAWKKITENWMFQLSLLFLIVVLVVLSDNFRNPPKNPEVISPPPVQTQLMRDENQNISHQIQSSFAAQNEEQPQETPVVKSAEPELKTPPAPAPPTARTAGETQQATFEVKMLSRSLLERLIADSLKLEETVFVLSKELFDRRIQEAPNLMRSFGLKKANYKVGVLSQFFVGEEDVLNDYGIGFFLQMTVIEKREDGRLNLGLRKWNQLKLNEELSQQAVLEVATAPNQVLLILEDNIGEMNFSNEERALFQSSNRLSLLNTPSLNSGLSEVVLVLEVKSL